MGHSPKFAVDITSQEKTTTQSEALLQPCGARLIVKLDEFSYRGRLIVPETAKRKPTTGKVVAIGEDVPDGKFALGDRILFSLFSGTLVSFQSKLDAESGKLGEPIEFRVLSIDEVLAKVLSDDLRLDYTAA